MNGEERQHDDVDRVTPSAGDTARTRGSSIDDSTLDCRVERHPRNRRAALVLAVLVPVIAELAYGSTPPHLAFLLILWTPVYGAGVLLIRELVRRVDGGWPSLVLLGLAYELVEDGIGLQALTSPHLYASGHWGRLFGLNLAYWEANAPYHIVFTVLIPIAVTELLFPHHGRRPYLRRSGLIGTATCAVLGAALLRITVPPFQDPGYQVPWPALLGIVVVIVILAVLALRVLPKRGTPGTVAPPRPVLLGLFGLTTMLAFALPMLGLSDSYADSPVTHGAVAALPMAWSALVAVASGAVVCRWALGDTDRIWLIGGLLVAHTAFGVVRAVHTVPDRIALSLIGVLTVVALTLLQRRVHRWPTGTATAVDHSGCRSPRRRIGGSHLPGWPACRGCEPWDG